MGAEVENLLTKWEEFIVPLRLKDGYSEARLDRLAAALHECARVWRTSEFIPRRAANVLVDIVPVMESMIYAYDGDPLAETIRDAQARLQEAVWECVAINPE